MGDPSQRMILIPRVCDVQYWMNDEMAVDDIAANRTFETVRSLSLKECSSGELDPNRL